jgi:AraC-like DNA-binding protein
VLSDYSYSVEDLRNAYTHAISLMMTRKYAPVNAVIAENRIEAEDSVGSGGSRPLLADDDLNSLRHFIKSGNRKMVRASVADKLKPTGGPPRSYLEIWQAVKQINALLMNNARPDAKADDVLALENLIDETARTVESLDIDAVLHCEEEAIDAAVGSKTFEGDDTMRGIVGQVREYIDGHYFEELSLSSLAERFAAERTYLSKSFKLFVGETLINYIAKKRIEKAIEHIREDKLTLSEISFLVGYYDYAYFSRVFKKIVGVSPSEYKRRVTE